MSSGKRSKFCSVRRSRLLKANRRTCRISRFCNASRNGGPSPLRSCARSSPHLVAFPCVQLVVFVDDLGFDFCDGDEREALVVICESVLAIPRARQNSGGCLIEIAGAVAVCAQFEVRGSSKPTAGRCPFRASVRPHGEKSLWLGLLLR